MRSTASDVSFDTVRNQGAWNARPSDRDVPLRYRTATRSRLTQIAHEPRTAARSLQRTVAIQPATSTTHTHPKAAPWHSPN
jgi:hypothetical protein